ncbi:ABC transporter permease [Haloarchaeobius salinus]|uniref:ABC transporter permease n=1 Tax=Haloarchaeobius salinus TaxID=1198298 RepID=UPI00210B0CED|nr:ABC transporter permease [Haloarchaeobius salinus]
MTSEHTTEPQKSRIRSRVASAVDSVLTTIQSRNITTGLFYAYTILLVLFLWLPLGVVIFLSFAENASNVFPFQGFTLEHFTATAVNASLLEAAFMSIQVAVLSASIATVLGILASFGIVRYDFRFKSLFMTSSLLPLIIPGVIFGTSFFIFFNTLLGDSTGFFPLVLAHSAYGFPFALLAVLSRLHTFDESLEESARDLGASVPETFWEITFPIIRPAIAAGFLFAFIRSFEDYTRALFVSGQIDVLTIEMFSLINQGGTIAMNVVSTIILIVSIIGLMAAMFLGDVVDHVTN